MRFEISSGGVVIKDGKVLLIKVKNLKGEVVWTFPKGHIENESPQEAAIREVLEETGYLCKIIKELKKVEYFFKHKGELIRKNVIWYLMEPVEKKGEFDKNEIIYASWVEINKAKDMLSYKSDTEIMNEIIKNGV